MEGGAAGGCIPVESEWLGLGLGLGSGLRSQVGLTE